MGAEPLESISILRVSSDLSDNLHWPEWVRQACDLLSQSSYSPSAHSLEDFLTACLSDSDSNAEKKLVFLAFDSSERVIGFIQLRSCLGDADLDFVVIAASHRRKGIAQRLIMEARDWFLGVGGVTRILLEVGLGNSSALALYRGFGFAEISRRRNYYRSGEDAIVMELKL